LSVVAVIIAGKKFIPLINSPKITTCMHDCKLSFFICIALDVIIK
jgi:hypothetical protein